MSKEHVDESQRHIVAFGGKISPAAPALLNYAFSLSASARPDVLFVHTATGDSVQSREMVERWLAGLNCYHSFLSFFERTPRDLRQLALSQDVIWVGGGNTKSMLAVWKAYGFDEILKEAWRKGITLAGSSAGGICWFEQCLTDSWADVYTRLEALALIGGSCCPHYDGELGRRETYHRLVGSGQLKSGYAIDETTGIHFCGTEVETIVSGVPEGKAYHVELSSEGTVVETAMQAEFLS
jgi:peptidase E